MPVYFASDIHIRLDRPDRGERLGRWVDTLTPADALYLVGDVCDFWFAAREVNSGVLSLCPGLRALASFRARGGRLVVLPGNHDLWLGPFYESALGAEFVQEPLEVEAHGLRFHVVHGHKAGGRQPWKGLMETRAFLRAFAALPDEIAGRLDRKLDESNTRDRTRDEARLVGYYRNYLRAAAPTADLGIFGHVHAPLDDRDFQPRLVVLGGWHRNSSHLRVDENGAELVVDRATSGTP